MKSGVNLIKTWVTEHPRVIIGIILLACLGPFTDKAVHWDDSLFVWTAQHIQKHPLDFFGFKCNWWYSDTPMWVANWNPPLFSYLLAAVGAIFGWSEIPLHLACLVIAGITALGIFSLAQMWCPRPLLATFVAIFTPAFMVSATTLMCDITMLAFWMWSLVFFERGLQSSKNILLFVLAGIFAGLALLTKYSVVTLLPLFFVLGVLRQRKLGWWLLSLAIPAAMLAGYEWWTFKLYGHGHFELAIHYDRIHTQTFPGGWTAKALVGLAFAGGSLLPLLFFAPLVWRWPWLLAGGTVIMGALVALFGMDHNPGLMIIASNELLKHRDFVAQIIVLIAAGLNVLFFVISQTSRQRDIITLVLGLWIISGMLFATELNWTVNARSFLPFVPAVAILLVRRIGSATNGWAALPLIPSVAIALCLAAADFQLADTGRTAAEDVFKQYDSAQHQMWFEGHDSFQYYMEKLGAKPIDVERSSLEPGDVVAIPQSGLRTSLPHTSIGWLGCLEYTPDSCMNVMGETGAGAAGFYAAYLGPVPFVLGEIPGQDYFVVKTFLPVHFQTGLLNPREVQSGEVPAFLKTSSSVGGRMVFFVNTNTLQQAHAAEALAEAGNFEKAIQTYHECLKSNPTNPVVLNNLAWLLSTCEKPEQRDGSEAVELASRAVALTEQRDPLFIGTLAAAYAENGQFSLAFDTAQIAARLAQVIGEPEIAANNEKLAMFYASGKGADAAAIR